MSWQFGVFVVAVGGVLYLVLRDQGETPAAPSSTPNARPSTITKFLDRTVAGPERVVTRDVPSFTQGATKFVQGPAAAADTGAKALATALAKSLGTFAAPLAPSAASYAVKGAGDFVQSGSLSAFSQGSLRSSGPGVGPLQPLGDKIGEALRGFGDSLGSVTPLAGVFGVAAATQKWTSSQKGETKIFGRAAETTVQTGVGYVPIVGGAISAVVGVLGGTYEGQRFFNNVLGRPIQQGYTVQKDLFNGDFKGVSDVFGLGGSTHKERVAGFYGGVTARLQQLDQGGGVISAADLASFKQALAYGYDPAASGNHALPYLPGNASTSDFRSWVGGLTAGKKFDPIATAQTVAAQTSKNFAAAKADPSALGYTAASAPAPAKGFSAPPLPSVAGGAVLVTSGKGGASEVVNRTTAFYGANATKAQVASGQSLLAQLKATFLQQAEDAKKAGDMRAYQARLSQAAAVAA